MSVQLIATANQFAPRATIALSDKSDVDGAAFVGADVRLAGGARLTNAQFDVASVLTIENALKRASAVALQNVKFASIARSLQTAPEFAACAKFELTTKGIDLLKSVITDSAGLPLLSRGDFVSLSKSTSAYWSRDGHLATCDKNAAVVRNEDKCGCPNNLLAAPHISHRVIANEKPVAKSQPAAAEIDVSTLRIIFSTC